MSNDNKRTIEGVKIAEFIINLETINKIIKMQGDEFMVMAKIPAGGYALLPIDSWIKKLKDHHEKRT